MKRIGRCGTVLIGMLLFFCILSMTGSERLTKPLPESVEIGITMFDEIQLLDPSMKAVLTSYGYMTFHELEDGTQLSIRFEYENGNFVAASMHTSEN